MRCAFRAQYRYNYYYYYFLWGECKKNKQMPMVMNNGQKTTKWNESYILSCDPKNNEYFLFSNILFIHYTKYNPLDKWRKTASETMITTFNNNNNERKKKTTREMKDLKNRRDEKNTKIKSTFRIQQIV